MSRGQSPGRGPNGQRRSRPKATGPGSDPGHVSMRHGPGTVPGTWPLWSVGDEGPGEVARVEGAQVVQAFADADQLHGEAELLRDRDRDAALRGAIELRQDDAGD